MPEGEFAYFHFTGGRFQNPTSDDEPGIPLEALGDLTLFRDLVVEVARHLWRLDNPDRQRAPKQWPTLLDLRLKRVEGGSITPIVERREVEGTLVDDHFDSGRDLIARSVDQVSTGGPLPREFPRSQVTRLSRLGSRLSSGERLDFGHPVDPGRRARLDAATSELLREIAEQLSSEQSDTRLRGYVAELDGDHDSFQLRTTAGRRVAGAIYTSDDADRVKEWLVVDGRDETLVEVVGPALVDAEGEVLRFDGFVTVREVPVTGIMAVFDGLAAASEAATADGTPVDGAVLRGLNERSESLAAHFPSLGFAPTEGGGIRVEWMNGDWDCSVDIDPDGTIFMHAFNAESGEDAEMESLVSSPDGWRLLDSFIREGRLE